MKKFALPFLLVMASLSFAQTYDERVSAADVFYQNKDFNKAIIGFTDAIQFDSKQARAYYFRGDALKELGRYTEAIADYTKAIELGDSKSFAYKSYFDSRATCYYATNEFEKAVADYTKCIELSSKTAYYFMVRANCYINLNQKDLACADYKSAFDLQNKDAKVFGSAYGCAWTAVEPIRLNEFDSEEEKEIVFANYYLEKGYPLLALNGHNRVLKSSPNNSDALFGRGMAFRQMNQYDRALQDFKKIMSMKSPTSSDYIARGSCYLALALYDSAIADFNEALNITYNNSGTWFYLGEAYTKAKRIDEACEAYRFGRRDAWSFAKTTGCDWAKKTLLIDVDIILRGGTDTLGTASPCAKAETVKPYIHPLTGMFIVSGGLKASAIKGISDRSLLLSDAFSPGVPTEIQFFDITDLCGTKNRKMNLGASFELFTEAGQKIFEEPNLISAQVGYTYVHSVTLSLSRVWSDTLMVSGKNYIFKARVFDRESKQEIAVSFYSRGKVVAPTAPAWDVKMQELSNGFNTAMFNTAISDVVIQDIKSLKPVLAKSMKASKTYRVLLRDLEGIQTGARYRIKYLDENGAPINTQQGDITLDGKNAWFTLPPRPTRNTFYFWIEVLSGTNKIGISGSVIK